MSEKKPKSSQRFHSLNTEQVEVLHQVLSEVVPIHGRGNFPTLELRPRDIIIAVRARLQKQGITVRDVRLNGSTASHVLVQDNGTTYKDLDIIFGVELPSQEEFQVWLTLDLTISNKETLTSHLFKLFIYRQSDDVMSFIFFYQVIKESVLGCLLDCLPAGVNRERISSATMKEAYVQKMVKVFNEHDRWSLISLSNNSGKNLELKFVSILRRQFEFSVDSFQIILDRLLESYMQQDSQSRISTAHLKDRSEDNHSKSSQPLLKQSNTPEKSTGDVLGKEAASRGQTQPRDEVLKKTQHSQSDLSNQTTQPNVEEHVQEKAPAELKEKSANLENLTGQACRRSSLSEKEETLEKTEPSTQSELVQEAEFLENTTPSTQAAQSEQNQPCDGSQPPPPLPLPPQELLCQSENSKPPTVDKDLTEQREAQPSTETQPGSPELAEEHVTDLSKSFHKGQGSNEKSETQSVCAPEKIVPSQAETDTQLADVTKVGDTGEAERKNTMEINEETGEILGSGAKNIEDRENIDFPCSASSTSLTIYNPQPAGTPDTLEISSLFHISDKTSSTVDGVSPPNTQDNLSAPPCLSSDKKTSCSSSKASDRLSHMVVLKHSSPKPPRRMCKKVVQSYQNPVSENDSVTAPCPDTDLSPNIERQLSSDPTQTALSSAPTPPPTNSVSTTPSPQAESHVSSNLAANLDLTSAPAPDISSAIDTFSPPNTDISCEMSIVSPEETQSTQEDQVEKSQLSSKETVAASEQMEPPDSVESAAPHSEVAVSDTLTPEHTPSEVTGEVEKRESWSKKLESSQPNSGPEDNPPSTSHCATFPVSCATPPLISLPLPSFTPSPPSLSPPPCVTPPPLFLSSPVVNASPATSLNSPPLSFSPSSSCLGSPYLTPPMLSLSPPPLSLSPPSPCLSPPLLCLTPPVESSSSVPQVSLDTEPLILNADNEGHFESCPQPEIPSLQLGGINGQDYMSSLPQVARPVSFPITIPSSTTHLLPPSPSGSPGEFTPPKVGEASSTVPENKDVPKVTADTPEQKNTPQASDSVPVVEVLAESMYGDFEAAMDHLRYRLIATRNPEEIRGGGLLKYSNLLVRDYRPASETQIKTLERYMCSRFFIDFPDVQEQQRKILSYLKNHFIGEERSKYQYLMTLRRVVDDSTVCLMGHERRQTLNMITVLALKVLGEQNIIPNTDHVTCFYQPAPYLTEHSAPYIAEPSYCNYFIPQGASTLLYQPYPLHLHTQTGLV